MRALSRRRVYVAVAAVLAVVLFAAGLALRNPSLLAKLFEQQARMRFAQQKANLAMFDGKALHVILCGTSSPLPDRDRAKACAVVIAGAKAYVVDTGPESWKTLALSGFPAQRIAGVMLTHFHSDHIGELGEFRLQTWVAGRRQALPVYGGPGVETVVAGFNQAFSLDDAYRSAHHGPEVAPLDAAALVARPFHTGMSDARDEAETILEEDGLKVTAFEVNHPPVKPAVGYRFDYMGRSVVISGDTTAWPNVAKWSKDADVLVHEAQSQHLRAILSDAARAEGNTIVGKIGDDIETYHSSPVDAAEIANQAGVRLLVYTHFTPPLATWLLEPVFFEGVEAIRPREKWAIGADGTHVELPVGGAEIRQSKISLGVFR